MSVGVRVPEAKAILNKADAVCFDVDSTVIREEGIDELAAYLGVGAEVAALTAAAMGGDVPFHKALEDRLAVMKPTKQQLEQMMSEQPMAELLTPGIRELIADLTNRGKRVYLVSGGFRQMIEPVATARDIPPTPTPTPPHPTPHPPPHTHTGSTLGAARVLLRDCPPPPPAPRR